MKQFLTVLCVLTFCQTISFAQSITPFDPPNTPKYYAVFGPQEQVDLSTNLYTPPQPSKLYQVDAPTGTLTKIGEGDMGVHINALAYNGTNNFLYGIVDSTEGIVLPFNIRQSAVMYRIGKNAAIERIGKITAPTIAVSDATSIIFASVGDMDSQGNFYFPAVVVHSFSTSPATIDYDLFIGRIPATELSSPKVAVNPIYTPVTRSSCAPIIDAYVLAYCQAVVLGQPRPNGGFQDWTINPYDGKLWSYIANDNHFFRLPLPSEASPNVPVTSDCFAAPIGYQDLTGSQLAATFFTQYGDMYAIDPGQGKYYKFTNCTSGNLCNNLSLVRTYTQAFGAPAYPTFMNLRADGACTGVGVVTPTNLPFPDCAGAQFSIFSEADSDNTGRYIYPGSSQLYSVSRTTGELTQIGINNMGKHFNGLAFNPADHFLYATTDSLWTDLSSGLPIIKHDNTLYRIDNASFPKKIQEITPPVTVNREQSFILGQAADMDAEGNYYFLAVNVETVNTTPPYAPIYTLYLGKISGNVLKSPTLPLALPLVPTYYKINASSCDAVFSNYIERYIAAIVNQEVRPRSGVQDFAINPKEKTIWAYLPNEQSFFLIPLPNQNTREIDATCAPISPALSMQGINQSAETAFYSNNGNSLYLTDATSALFYELKDCTASDCAAIAAVASYDLAFSATKLDFKNLIGDGAGCTFANLACDASAYHVLSKKSEPDAASQLYNSTSSVTGTLFTKVNEVASGGAPLNVSGLLYNAADGYLYGLNDQNFTGSPTLYRIDANGNAQTVANLPTPPVPTFYNNTYILPTPIAATPSLQNRKSVVFSTVSTASEDGKSYLLATAYSFDKTSPSVIGYDVLNYDLYVAQIGLANPNISFSFYEIDINQPTFTCRDLLSTNLFNAITYVSKLSNTAPAIQDWALDPTNTKLLAYDAGSEAVVSISLPQGASTMATAQCYDAAVANNSNTAEINGIHFGQDGLLYGIDGSTGRAYSINIANCPSDTPNQCATIGTSSSLPDIGTPPSNNNLVGNSASCITRSPLPVTLFRFIGTNNGCSNHLKWITASELNNDYFQLQKSLDGVNYATIAKIDGVGNSNAFQTYSFIDNGATKNCYYRLRQVDIDGTEHSFSTIVSLQSTCVKKGKVGIETAFPNPTTSSISILYNASIAQSGDVKGVLIDATGKVVSEIALNLQEDSNLIALEMKSLPSGVYAFYLKGENWLSEPQRIVKL